MVHVLSPRPKHKEVEKKKELGRGDVSEAAFLLLLFFRRGQQPIYLFLLFGWTPPSVLGIFHSSCVVPLFSFFLLSPIINQRLAAGWVDPPPNEMALRSLIMLYILHLPARISH